LENVMIGGTIDGRGTFLESLLALPRHWKDEKMLRETATLALSAVGLEQLAAVRADRLQHSELRFIEIARALMLRPAFLLLDEPAAGLSTEEIKRLSELIRQVSRRGAGVLLVEHHADLIFDICDHVTVLNLGRVLAEGTPAEIRVHKEVVSAYLGGGAFARREWPLDGLRQDRRASGRRPQRAPVGNRGVAWAERCGQDHVVARHFW